MGNKPSRKSNIELLRIITILGVVILHYNHVSLGGGFAAVEPNSLNEILMILLESASIIAVDLFVLISGYFMINSGKRGIIKPLSLYVQMFFVNLLFYGVELLTTETAFSGKGLGSCFLPTSWFVNFYVALYLISPFINKAINGLDKRLHKVLLIVTILLFSIEPTVVDIASAVSGKNCDSMSMIGFYGSQKGYTIVQFVVMYVIGALIRIYEEEFRKKSGLMFFLGAVLCAAVNSLWYEYCSPLVMLGAVCMFGFFLKINMKDSKVINTLARGAFTTYLAHLYLLKYFRIEEFVKKNPAVYLVHTILTAVIIFIVSFVVFIVFDLITKALFKWLTGKLKAFEYEV